MVYTAIIFAFAFLGGFLGALANGFLICRKLDRLDRRRLKEQPSPVELPEPPNTPSGRLTWMSSAKL
jgi:hypothetical protein